MDKIALPKDHADQQIKNFMTSTGALMVAARTVSIDELIAAYFDRKTPFSNKGKKDEFPDAIALLVLEQWAEKNEKCVLAVSKDGDWKAFCEKSDWIDCVDDLRTAMGTLLKEAEDAAQEAANDARFLVQGIINGERKEDDWEIRSALTRATELEAPHIEYDSGGIAQAQEEYTSVSFVDYKFAIDAIDELDITVISLTDEGFVATMPVKMDVKLETEFTFFVYDSVDKDDVPFGSDTIEHQETIDATLIVHFEKCGEGSRARYRIDDVEISDFPSTFNIGEVSLSFGEEDSDFDPDDWKPEEDRDRALAAEIIDDDSIPI